MWIVIITYYFAHIYIYIQYSIYIYYILSCSLPLPYLFSSSCVLSTVIQLFLGNRLSVDRWIDLLVLEGPIRLSHSLTCCNEVEQIVLRDIEAKFKERE